MKQHDNAQSGRHLRASGYVSAGKRILHEEAAAAVLYDDGVAKRCHTSFKIVQSPLRCGGCKFARYASRDDQRLAWQLGHREECAALQACSPNIPPATVRLVARLFWRRDRCGLLATLNFCISQQQSLLFLQAQSPSTSTHRRQRRGQLGTSLGRPARQQEAVVRSNGCFDQVCFLLFKLCPIHTDCLSSTQALT